MSGRTFFDTNIFVYAAGGEGGRKAIVADQLISDAIEHGHGVISYQVAQEFLNVALKKFAVPLTPDQARMYMSATFRPMFAVQASLGFYSEALDIYSGARLSWYDSLIVAAAVEAKCGVLYSEDLQHGAKIGCVRIQNPFRA